MSTPGAGRVAVITLGGTIAMTSQDGNAVTPTLAAEDLVAAVPGLAETGIPLEVHNFRQLPGASLGFADLVALVKLIEGLDVDGVVVTQGTDTIEETAFVLDLLHRDERPVVVTGAMRNPSMAGADGPANLLAAVRVAAAGQSPGSGCVVVFGEEIHAARRVRKTHSSSPTAFGSYPGPIGFVAEDRVRFWSRPERWPALPADELDLAVRTGLVTLVLGDDGAVLKAAGGQVDGLVVAGFGVGHAPAACVEVLTELAGRLPVILASRTGSGPVLTGTYGFPGSESDLLGRGLISAGTLDPLKARILLHVLLMAGLDREVIRRRLAELGNA